MLTKTLSETVPLGGEGTEDIFASFFVLLCSICIFFDKYM